VSDILADPAWASLDAVKNKQVYRMPKYLLTWETPGPESVLGTMWMAKTLYPDSVSFDLEKEIKDFYMTFYNIDLSSGDVQSILSDQSMAQLNKKV
jgi:iron complex transport system substrate-binding protein